MKYGGLWQYLTILGWVIAHAVLRELGDREDGVIEKITDRRLLGSGATMIVAAASDLLPAIPSE